MKLLKNKISLTVFSLVLSIVNLVLFHGPFFSYVTSHVEPGFNGNAIIVCLVLLMIAANFFAAYLILWLLRGVGRFLAAAGFIISSITMYFIKTYDVLIDDTMMGNVFNTNTAEATSYVCLDTFLYLFLLGILPAALVFIVRIDFGSAKRFFANIGAAVVLMLGLAIGNMTNWPWIDKNAPVIGSLLMPWSYTVNTVRFKVADRKRNAKEILLPDASLKDTTGKKVLVLVIGESDRRDHFSIYGYERETTPVLSSLTDVRAYAAKSAATYTTAGVKAILDHKKTDRLYEILPNYLYRAGVDVQWRTSNWGESPLHIEKRIKIGQLSELSSLPAEYDETLLYNLAAEIDASDSDRVLMVIHTSISHGPSYNKRYPKEFERYTPVYDGVEMSKCPVGEVVNAYDNSILYTDYVLGKVIEALKSLDDWESCMLFVGDHGESLGENNLYMHGIPISLAPAEQYEIPFIVWTSPGAPAPSADEESYLSQYCVFHSVLHFLDIDSQIYNPELDIFNQDHICEK